MDHAQVQESPAASSLETGAPQPKSLMRFARSLAASAILSLGKIALVAIIGLLVNWGLLVLFFWTLHGHTDSDSHTLALWVVGMILGLVFPAAYLMAGQNLGAQVLMRHIYRWNRDDFQDFLIAVLRKCVLDGPQSGATISRDHVRRVLKQIHGMPWAVRVLLKFYVRDMTFQLLLVQMITDDAFRSENARALKNKYGPRLDTFIMENVLEVNTSSLWLLLIMNIAGAALLLVWAFLR
jgi:prepilin signal peptidase PulO-like enzyme (type II secretory pathway)